MNRRHFAQTILGGLGVSLLAGQTAQAVQLKKPARQFEAGHQMRSDEGLKMTLSEHNLPTADKDRQQFILTFDVHNQSTNLQEKIYQLTDHNGKRHEIYMTPVAQNKLQAVYNWRTHA